MATFYGRGGSTYANTPEQPVAAATTIVTVGSGSTIVVDGTGPAITFKGFRAGINVALTEAGDDIIISVPQVSLLRYADPVPTAVALTDLTFLLARDNNPGALTITSEQVVTITERGYYEIEAGVYLPTQGTTTRLDYAVKINAGYIRGFHRLETTPGFAGPVFPGGSFIITEPLVIGDTIALTFISDVADGTVAGALRLTRVANY